MPNAVTQVTVTPTKNHSGAMVAFTPSTDASTTTGHQVNLNVGANPIVVTVTAEDGSTQPYTVTVTREARGSSARTRTSPAAPRCGPRTWAWRIQYQ